MEKLSLDELEMVSGGTEINEDAQASGRCPSCGALLKPVEGGYQCLSCPGRHIYTEQELKGVTSTGPKKDPAMRNMSGGRDTQRIWDVKKYRA